MTIHILFGDEIRSHVLKILSGECVFERRQRYPKLYILSPWISDVQIEFSDRHIKEELHEFKTKGYVNSFLVEDYNIKSINLAYALLLFKLHGACEEYQHIPEVNIVALPPDEDNYSPSYLPKVKTLLDFLDEIGCNVFVNPKLHSKLLLANDLALLGSFNLSTSALYNREEIGVSINDLDNLDRLEEYCEKVVYESQRYGYSGSCFWNEKPTRVTRGWLLDYMIENVYPEGYGEFLFITGGYDKSIKSYASDLNLFYLMCLRKLISKGKDCIKGLFGCESLDSVDSTMDFVNNKFARKRVPDIKLRIKPL